MQRKICVSICVAICNVFRANVASKLARGVAAGLVNTSRVTTVRQLSQESLAATYLGSRSLVIGAVTI